MTRARDRHRRGTQYTGILRGNRSRSSEEREVNQIEEKRSWFGWRIVSGLIVVCLSGVLMLFFLSDVFYVTSIRVGGAQYMTVQEVFTYADIANWHIFWVTPEQVRENLLRYPTVADAQVRISWPPDMVNIFIEEREPALVWEQNGAAVWVDIQGNIMAQREDRADLSRVLVDNPLSGDLISEQGKLDTDIVIGSLQLQELRPDVELWRYDPNYGLGFRNQNGWDVWFGIGANMTEKMRIYDTIASDIIARGIQPGEINIVNPDSPFYTVLWGR